MDDFDFYRRQVTLATARAEVAENLVLTLRREQEAAAGRLNGTRQENTRLRTLVDRLEAEIQTLRERLRQLETRRLQVPVQTLVRSLTSAIEDGSKGWEDRVLSRVHLDLKVALQTDGEVPGVLAAAGSYPPEALSTISLDLRPAPPQLGDEGRQRGLAQVLNAVLELQHSLDRVMPPAAPQSYTAALAQAAAFINAELTPETVEGQLGGLVATLQVLSPPIPALAQALAAVEARRHKLPALPSEDDLAGLAGAITLAVRVLDQVTP